MLAGTNTTPCAKIVGAPTTSLLVMRGWFFGPEHIVRVSRGDKFHWVVKILGGLVTTLDT
jgi:hypothetical protein